jgi:hypothetical protein
MLCRDALRQRAGGPRHGGPGNHAAVAARLSALEERPLMSPQRLGVRLTRLEHDAHRVLWVADVCVSLVVSFRQPCLTSNQNEQSCQGWHSGVLTICIDATHHSFAPSTNRVRTLFTSARN